MTSPEAGALIHLQRGQASFSTVITIIPSIHYDVMNLPSSRGWLSLLALTITAQIIKQTEG